MLARPRMENCIASVTIKGGSFRQWIRTPLSVPMAQEAATASRIAPIRPAAPSHSHFTSAVPRIMPERQAFAPTERSIPPVMTQNSMPNATISAADCCLRRLLKFRADKKLSDRIDEITRSATNATMKLFLMIKLFTFSG